MGILSAFVMAHAVTEVQELGNDDTSTALDADTSMDLAHEDEEDDLGEDDGQGRRGAFLSTTGSFTLSSGGGANGGPGGTEEDDELGEDVVALSCPPLALLRCLREGVPMEAL